MRLILAVLSVVALLGGCAVFDPYVGADDISNKLRDIRSAATIPTALSPTESIASDIRARAAALQEVLQDKANDYHRFDQVSGVLLIGAGLTAAGFGIFGGPRDAVLASGLAGGGIAGVRAFVPSAARQRIYLQGAQAVNCAAVGVRLPAPAVTADRALGAVGVGSTASLQGTLAASAGLSGSLAATVESLDRTSRGLTSQPTLSALTAVAALQGRLLVEAMTAADSAVGAALAQAPALTSGERLDFAVDGIRLAVNSAILNSSVDAADALESALTGVSGITQQAKAAFQAARDAVERKKEKAAETSATAAKAAEEAGTGTATAADARELQGLAQQVEENADEQLSILNTVLASLDIEVGCVGELR